ncbi:signal transduction histidine kinase [Salinibacterium amurskyense]|uniref:Signal transduction histidine kinase n=1 Tax=Salinibacterium amurskyense TaxID=205941 RepID=A0A2M9D2L2_9MICO|nr:histidine kinase [Salinibacterium amurskyense]PJJ78422.1 signal transduction histidine kinase [Salinibacterium amurskyense]RLQ80522.1 sensor histidine kinase [Salinibacterium amurskyense]GHD83267.1 two-component sensor histidine kinase [Salinibacterium amurskyense]
MGFVRWMSIAVTVTTAVMAVLIVGSGGYGSGSKIGAGVALAAFALAWFALGIRARDNSVMAIAYVSVLVITVGAAVAFMPVMATLQSLAYPLVWVLAERTRNAIIGNVALALSVGVGFLLNMGLSADAVLYTTTIVALSLIFSLALGLWITQISRLSDQRHDLVLELQSTRDELAAISRDAGVSSERERLAREIHDTIAQDLTGLVLVAQRAKRELDNNNAAAAAEQLELIEDSARAALAEARALVTASAPVGLTGDGITSALTRLAERYSRETQLTVTVDAAHLPAIARETEVVVLRCAQEALANVRKHANATRATITVTVGDDGLTIAVADDGTGFDPATTHTGFGLEGMSERLALVNGRLDVESSAAGTTVRATIPKEVFA